MEIQEICIGDYVSIDGVPHIVNAVHGDKGAVNLIDREFLSYANNLEPIPLTEEILENSGFEKQKNPYLSSKNKSTYKSGSVEVSFPNKYSTDDILLLIESTHRCVYFQIKYVHELQQAMRICKIEKFIKCK